MKAGWQSTEFWVAIAGVLALVLPQILTALPEGSKAYVILSALIPVVAYIAGRSWLKVTAIKADTITKAVESGAAPSDPPKP